MRSPPSEFHTIDVLPNVTRDQHGIGAGRTRPNASWERSQAALPSHACLLQFPLHDREPNVERCASSLRRAGDARACSRWLSDHCLHCSAPQDLIGCKIGAHGISPQSLLSSYWMLLCKYPDAPMGILYRRVKIFLSRYNRQLRYPAPHLPGTRARRWVRTTV